MYPMTKEEEEIFSHQNNDHYKTIDHNEKFHKIYQNLTIQDGSFSVLELTELHRLNSSMISRQKKTKVKEDFCRFDIFQYFHIKHKIIQCNITDKKPTTEHELLKVNVFKVLSSHIKVK